MITKKTMENVLGIAELAFTTAKTDEEIKTPLLEYNYDDARLDQCLAVHKKAKEDYQKQIKERSDQFQATAELETALDEANPVYIEHITLTRLALRNKPKKKSKFALAESRRRDIYGWIEQAEVFYDNAFADEEVLNEISTRFGLTREKLEKGKQLVLKVKEANKKQEKEKSEAQQATEDRDKSFKVLYDILSEFYQVSQFALVHKPQLLERLGYLKLSTGYGYRRRVNNQEEENETENDG
ncbi:MAG: hypothetical protein JSV88_13670 [Candidatus Aminicenantes bacterium]|nr:MAG: hypothetical protein JSV88_13670 [Candidatus Aminicenantes bacterium]